MGVLSVVASLLFVGREIRQNTKVARGQTRFELTALNNDFLARLADPEFADIWRRAWLPGGELTAIEEQQVMQVTLQFLRLIENVHLQYQEGLIDHQALNGYGFFEIREREMQHPRFAEIWEPGCIS